MFNKHRFQTFGSTLRTCSDNLLQVKRSNQAPIDSLSGPSAGTSSYSGSGTTASAKKLSSTSSNTSISSNSIGSMEGAVGGGGGGGSGSISSGSRRNLMNLTIATTPSPTSMLGVDLNLSSQQQQQQQSKEPRLSHSQQGHQELDESQRKRLAEFVQRKRSIGELRHEDFEDIAELGSGSSGVVQRVLHRPTRQAMARKLIHLEIKPSVRAQIIRELEVLHSCNSPYIIGYFGAYFVDSSATICICMEYMNAGSLDLVLTKAGRLPEPIVARISCSVLRGLIYLRENINCLHRDVKPSNILVSLEGDCKLCDFGVSGQLIDSMANSFVGTRSYMAPERLNGEEYSILSDVWSMGLSLVELATGRYPIPQPDSRDYTSAFSSDRQRNLTEHREAALQGTRLKGMEAPQNGPKQMAIFELLSYIVYQQPPKLPSFAFSEKFCDFVDCCLRKNPKERLGLESLLRHEFVQIYDPIQAPEFCLGRYLRTVLADAGPGTAQA